ncbi:MAG TPA: hypothetical protein VF665_12200 [Longimicrobium sp.]|uniref:hypothetical protein n=1 Tax=Longimicrobium sp. TaxID=2029185 RepID=UPI002ED9E802
MAAPELFDKASKLLHGVVQQHRFSHPPRTHQQHGAPQLPVGDERKIQVEVRPAPHAPVRGVDGVRRFPPDILGPQAAEHLLLRNRSHRTSVTQDQRTDLRMRACRTKSID